jgi:hypothetical protein
MYQVVGTAAAQGVPSLEAISSTNLSGEDGLLSPPLGADSAGGFQSSSRRRPSISISRRPSIADLSAALSPSTSNTSITSASGADPSSSRRARNNAQHRTNDIELATEIGQSLLVEVRRLQALLQEKEEHVQGLARERDAMKAEVEQAQVQRKTVEESVGSSSVFFSFPFLLLILLCVNREVQGGQLGTRALDARTPHDPQHRSSLPPTR